MTTKFACNKPAELAVTTLIFLAASIGVQEQQIKMDKKNNRMGLTGDTRVTVVDELTKEYVTKAVHQLIGREFETKTPMGSYYSTSDGFWSNGMQPVRTIALENKTSIRTSRKHEFYIGNGKYVEAEKLREGDHVIGKNESDKVRILGIKDSDEKEEVFACAIIEADLWPTCLSG